MSDLPVPDHDAAEAGRAARDILARAEFQRPGKSWIQRLTSWIGDLLNRLFGGIGGGSGSFIGWVLLAGAAVAIVALLYRFVRDRARRSPLEPVEPPEISVRTDAVADAARWRARSDELAAAGHWREALRARYRALASELGRHDLVSDSPAVTAGEERQQLGRNAPRASEPFAGATELFEAGWYGEVEVGPDDLDRFDRLARDVTERTR